MFVAELGVDGSEALAVLRAYAYVNDVHIDRLIDDILDGTLTPTALNDGTRSTRWCVRMSDPAAQHARAKRHGRAVAHPRPDGMSDDTVTALGELSAALKTVEHARGQLYAFHRLSGSFDLALQKAVQHLREAGHSELADEIEEVLVGRT